MQSERISCGQGLLGVTDADFCCGMRWPGDTTGLTNQSSVDSSNDPENQNKNQNNNHYTPHQYLRTHLRGPFFNFYLLLLRNAIHIEDNWHHHELSWSTQSGLLSLFSTGSIYSAYPLIVALLSSLRRLRVVESLNSQRNSKIRRYINIHTLFRLKCRETSVHEFLCLISANNHIRSAYP